MSVSGDRGLHLHRNRPALEWRSRAGLRRQEPNSGGQSGVLVTVSEACFLIRSMRLFVMQQGTVLDTLRDMCVKIAPCIFTCLFLLM